MQVGRDRVEVRDGGSPDLHGTDDYRKKVGAAMVARAWEKAIMEAANG